MNNNQNKATLKRVLRGLLVVGVIVAVVGVGVYFYFSDVEESPGNKITAGTLDLTVMETATISEGALGRIDSQNCETAQNGIECTVEISNIAPSDTGTIEWTLKNDGSLPGYLTVAADIQSDEGGDPTEPELDAEEDYPGFTIDKMLTATLLIDGVEANTQTPSLASIDEFLNEEIDKDILATHSRTYTLVWEFPSNDNSTFDNVAQGDFATIDLTFYLDQTKDQTHAQR